MPVEKVYISGVGFRASTGGGGGGGLTNGDKGDIVVAGSGSSLTIDTSSVTSTKIADSAVTTAKIDNSGVTTAKINDLAVTKAKIASDLDAYIIAMAVAL